MTIPVAPMGDAVSRMSAALARAEQRISHLESLEFPIPPGYRLLGVSYYYYTGGIETYTPDSETTAILVEAVGGGGGGGGRVAGTDSCGGGGGAGGYARSLIEDLEDSYEVYVGSGGNGGPAGSAGEGTTFGSTLVIARGGQAGGDGVVVVPPQMAATPGAGGGSSGYGSANVGDVSVAGGAGGWGISLTATSFGSGKGGNSLYGGGGVGRITFGNGLSARNVGYGGGGGGSIGQSSTGGYGAHGLIIIWELTDNPEGGGGGGLVDPAETVVTETSYSQGEAVGISLKYAREDHTHGTPPYPYTPQVYTPDIVHIPYFATVVAGNPLTYNTTLGPFAGHFYQFGWAVGDQRKFYEYLAIGTYTVKVLGTTDPNGGIFDFKYKLYGDPSYTDIATGVDTYAGAAAPDVTLINTTLTITADRLYEFLTDVTGQNGLSGGFALYLSRIAFTLVP